jgi:protein-L-isoaspartate(D-aspartate) O-methyltransferase
MASDSSFDDPAAARRAMIEHQLRGRGVQSERVLAAISRVPRERFVPAAVSDSAYADSALPIDCAQTISQPIIVAMMTDALQLSGSEKVLEVGTGSGYQTAILAELAAKVSSVERHPELSRQAGELLSSLGYRNVLLRIGDGSLGWPEEAPFDRIIITAGADKCPPLLWEQLREGGVLVGPFGPLSDQALYEIHKVAGQAQSRFLTACRFVPLVSESADVEKA